MSSLRTSTLMSAIKTGVASTFVAFMALGGATCLITPLLFDTSVPPSPDLKRIQRALSIAIIVSAVIIGTVVRVISARRVSRPVCFACGHEITDNAAVVCPKCRAPVPERLRTWQ